ncbi:MAG: NADH-quinone oxidoreductase subunit NuoI [Candidatus Marinimicrobia bacterium]|jgi:NADH-quinone oxidoreductase subunit I|nr:NADH-quinone oxidoreductase subunit NuoI [Candidatus Neomarinimicrobiota bacterium]MDP6456422.1 NADH-quinone oxidoreductase subunit NuoI [Candidatus Neomarinimicrobiota bacterium]MDP6592914.1 NADH-quinone oxidoreductase subunit NuoI [Candidatus Neomarinimicrobiota bacterium]MDP6836807.1 NADH-quinone oxidoreductase subunit NuoI [Candidatus Neomarinimicrobiota bacterium]|tara:strand:+ start:470 stop:991 length:522 start_codon:yes stop_codon:yes gene_type:complete
MATIVTSYEPTFWDKLYIPALLNGLKVTLRHFFQKKVTIQYPDTKHIPPEGYRGLHRLNKCPNGRIRCVACEMCAAACPSRCIHIVPGASPWEDGKERYPVRFDIDLLRCIYCGFCEQACPEQAIELTEIYDFSNSSREGLWMNKDGLLEVYEMTKNENYYQKQNQAKELRSG